MAQNYKNAFKCTNCPGSNDENGCPQWVEYVETNVTTQEIRVEKGCAGQLFPKMMLHVLAASNRPAAAIESMRNGILDGFNGIGRVLSQQVFEATRLNGTTVATPLLGSENVQN